MVCAVDSHRKLKPRFSAVAKMILNGSTVHIGTEGEQIAATLQNTQNNICE